MNEQARARAESQETWSLNDSTPILSWHPSSLPTQVWGIFQSSMSSSSSIFQNSSFNGKASSWVSEVQVTHLGPPMAYVNARHKLRSQLKVEWIREWMNEWHFWPQGPQESEKLGFGVCNDRNPLPLILNPFIHLTLNMLSFWGPNKKELHFSTVLQNCLAPTPRKLSGRSNAFNNNNLILIMTHCLAIEKSSSIYSKSQPQSRMQFQVSIILAVSTKTVAWGLAMRKGAVSYSTLPLLHPFNVTK